MKFLKKWKGLWMGLLAEIGLYLFMDIKMKLDIYLPLWIAIFVFLILLDIFRVEPTKGYMGMGTNSQQEYAQLSSSYLEKVFTPKLIHEVSNKIDRFRNIIEYVILILINVFAMFWLDIL